MERNQEPGWNTILQHYGEDEKILGAVTPPIFQNSLFVFDTVEEMATSMGKTPAGPKHHYSRISNPTVDLAEKKLAKLEGTDACKLTGSGMAALSVAVISCVKQGSHIVAVDTAYGPLKNFVSDYLAKFGVTHTFVDGADVAEVEAAIRPETSAIYLESPSSMVFRLQDLGAIANIAKRRGIATICDNTYCTPLLMQPYKMGIDIVCHSVTKYLAGHSDMTAGAICASQDRIDSMIRREIALFGSILHPFQAWLLTRSMRTLDVRLKRHEETANTIAAWLEKRKEVDCVHHISLPSFPQRKLYLKMMSGSGGLFSFEPNVQNGDRVKAFANALKIFQRGVSWGGFESLVVVSRVSSIAYEQPKWVVRLYCGLEDAEDLMADIEQAMKHLR